MKTPTLYIVLLTVIFFSIFVLATIFYNSFMDEPKSQILQQNITLPPPVNISVVPPTTVVIPNITNISQPKPVQKNISVIEAIRIARTEVNGNLHSVSVVVYQEKLAYAVDFGSTNEQTDVYVDIKTGEILGIRS